MLHRSLKPSRGLGAGGGHWRPCTIFVSAANKLLERSICLGAYCCDSASLSQCRSGYQTRLSRKAVIEDICQLDQSTKWSTGVQGYVGDNRDGGVSFPYPSPPCESVDDAKGMNAPGVEAQHIQRFASAVAIGAGKIRPTKNAGEGKLPEPYLCGRSSHRSSRCCIVPLM